MAGFGEDWPKRYHRTWWQKSNDVPLDVLAFLVEPNYEDSLLHRTVREHLGSDQSEWCDQGRPEKTARTVRALREV